MENRRKNLTLTKYFDANTLDEFPSNNERIINFNSDYDEGYGYLAVEVDWKNGNSWIGKFPYGYKGKGAETGLYSYPDEKSLLIVSRGRGFLVNAKDPVDWSVLDIFPIMNVVIHEPSNQIIIGSYTDLVAYNPEGKNWKTGRLVTDGLKIDRTTANKVICSGWEPEEGNDDITILVNVSDGSVSKIK